ncbi:hypothetical protein C8Q75DRAFT_808460 [Abortiporus biennis]|nr:hypothetical protein C8Q75DRAFT_808460 [Abortiporus biennis]
MEYPLETLAMGPFTPTGQVNSLLSSYQKPQLDCLLNLQISMDFINIVADCVVDVVRAALDRQGMYPTSSALKTPNFVHFVASSIVRSRAPIATVLVALAYVERARQHLRCDASFLLCERVFLGAFILAHKYTNDSWMRASTWARLVNVLGASDIVRIEREYLDVLDYNLSIKEEDLLVHYDTIMSRCIPWYSQWKSIMEYQPPNQYLSGQELEWGVPSPSSSRSQSPTDSLILTPPNAFGIASSDASNLPCNKDQFDSFYPTSDKDSYSRWMEGQSAGSLDSLGSVTYFDAAMEDWSDIFHPWVTGSLRPDGKHTRPDLLLAPISQERTNSTLQTLPHVSEVLPPSLLQGSLPSMFCPA